MLLLLDDDLVFKSEEITSKVISQMFFILLTNDSEEDLKEKVLEVIDEVAERRPTVLSDRLDVLVGFLTDQVKALKTFKWYRSELDKPKDQISTFNPLQGKNFFTVDSQEHKLQNGLIQTKNILKNLIEHNGYQACTSIIKIISNLSSTSDSELKSQLIAVVKEAVSDPIHIADLLPHIYNFLFDIDSKQVRYEGINFARHLIEKHDQLVTQTIIDTIKVFMNDTDIGVRGKAIEVFGIIIQKFPEQVERQQLKIILNSVTAPYAFVHKHAARLVYKAMPFFNDSQERIFLIGILHQEKIYYKEKEYEYCKELIRILLFLTKEKSQLYSAIVNKYVVKYCDTQNYYTDKYFIEMLTKIRQQDTKFSKVWLYQTIAFLSRTRRDMNNSPAYDSRNGLFATIYELPQEIILQSISETKELVLDRINRKDFADVFELFSILSFFNLYSHLYELSQHFHAAVESTKSTEYAIEKNKSFERVAKIEMAVAAQTIDDTFI